MTRPGCSCGGFAYECACNLEVADYSVEGYPLNSENEVLMHLLTPEQRAEIYAKLVPVPNLRVRQAW